MPAELQEQLDAAEMWNYRSGALGKAGILGMLRSLHAGVSMPDVCGVSPGEARLRCGAVVAGPKGEAVWIALLANYERGS